MTQLDEIRAEIEARLSDAQQRFDSAVQDCGILRAELAAHDRAVAAMSAPADLTAGTQINYVPRRSWISVRRPVMALFGPEKGTWTAAGAAKATGLPEDAVRQFLLRAVKTGQLRRLPTHRKRDANAEYGMVLRPTSEAAK